MRRRWVGWTAGGVLLILVVVLIWLGVDANAVAAVATAIAALASLASARQSSASARDATRALGWATKPVIVLNVTRRGDESEVLLIANDSPHPVRRAVVSWTTRDGTEGRRTLGEVSGGQYSRGMEGVAYFGSTYDPIKLAPWSDAAGTTKVQLDYWGTAATAWRMSAVFTWTPQLSGAVLPEKTITSDVELN